jgi:hypothetical protein
LCHWDVDLPIPSITLAIASSSLLHRQPCCTKKPKSGNSQAIRYQQPLHPSSPDYLFYLELYDAAFRYNILKLKKAASNALTKITSMLTDLNAHTSDSKHGALPVFLDKLQALEEARYGVNEYLKAARHAILEIQARMMIPVKTPCLEDPQVTRSTRKQEEIRPTRVLMRVLCGVMDS